METGENDLQQQFIPAEPPPLPAPIRYINVLGSLVCAHRVVDLRPQNSTRFAFRPPKQRSINARQAHALYSEIFLENRRSRNTANLPPGCDPPLNGVQILVATKPADFHKGHDGPAALVRTHLQK